MEFKQLIQRSPTSLDPSLKKEKHYATAAQRKKLLRLWERSELNKKDFCAQYNVQPHTLSRWLRGHDSKKNKESAVKPKGLNKQDSLEICFLEFKFPNGTILNFSSAIDRMLPGSIIRDVSECKFN